METENNSQKQKIDWKIAVSILALLMTMGGTVYNAGSLSNKIEANTNKFDTYVENHAALHLHEEEASNERYDKITTQLAKLMDMTVETQKCLAGIVAVNAYRQGEASGTDKTE